MFAYELKRTKRKTIGIKITTEGEIYDRSKTADPIL